MSALTDLDRSASTATAKQHLLDAIVDHAICMLDIDGIVRSWNKGAERLKGYRGDDIIGQHFSIFYTQEDRDAYVPAAALSIASATGRYAAEAWRVRADGSRFWASVVMHPVRDDHGALIGFAQITRDESNRQTVSLLRDQLFRVQKVQSLGQLTGGVAHEFNNLLAAISCSVELMIRNSDNERTLQMGEIAQHAVARGKNLIDQLLAFTKRQHLRPVPTDVNALIMSFEALLRQAAGTERELVIDFPGNLPWVNIDQAQLQTALFNLLINARDASPAGSTISLTAQRMSGALPGGGAGGAPSTGDYVRITVSDTGEGMSERVLARAVEPFFTTRSPGERPGLGLSQVDGFMRQSRGQLQIESRLGDGTSVHLLLPAMMESEVKPAVILLVEDDPLVREVVTETLAEQGFTVHIAANSNEALEILSREPEIDLLFSDIVMPRGLNGIELAKHVRRTRPETRILLTSGYSSAIARMKPKDCEGMEVLAKPYRDSELCERIAALLAKPAQESVG